MRESESALEMWTPLFSATMVNNQLIDEENPPTSTGSKARRRRTNTKDPLESLGNRVSESWRKVTSGELCT